MSFVWDARRHCCIIEPVNAEQCRFVHGEKMVGLVPGVLRPSIMRARPAYLAMNQSLKERAEHNQK